MLFSSNWRIIFVVLLILKFSSLNYGDQTGEETVSSVFATMGFRPEMEDTFIRIESDNGVGIYGIFDGHNGNYASKFAAGFFPEMIHDEIVKYAKHPERSQCIVDSKLHFGLILEASIKEAEAYLKERFKEKKHHSGTTCLLVIAEKAKLTVANLGDSRGVMCNINGTAINLSTDHKPDSPKEKERIEKAYGSIRYDGVWRVNGLAMSRSLGDHCIDWDKTIISGEPDISTYELDEYRPKFMILASDGIWDAISSQEAVDFIKVRLTQEDFGAKRLAMHVQYRTFKRSTDNIAVVIVKFNANGHYEVGSASA